MQPQSLWQRAQPFLQNRDLALALLANSGGQVRQGFGPILGQSLMQADAAQEQRKQQALQQQLLQAQIANLPNQGKTQNIRDYEFYKGLPPEEQAAFSGLSNSSQGGDPSEVRAYKYWSGLTPEQKQEFLKLKRNVGSDYAIETVNGVPTVVYKPAAGGVPPGGTPLVTPLTNLGSQAAGAGAIKQAEAQAGALGTAQGNVAGGIQTKGSNAKVVLTMADEAEKLIDQSTGSALGAGIDTVAGAFGRSTEGAQAIARLKVLQAGMMLNMPRMEGPQSDRDVQLYRDAAASIGDPTVPKETRKAALKTIRDLQNFYAERANASGSQSAPAKRRYNPVTGKIE